MMKARNIVVGTLFSGIGAFEHALKQLDIPYKIQFACDCGEREIPMRFGDLQILTSQMKAKELFSFCDDYINQIGVKREFRTIESNLLFQHIQNGESHKPEEIVAVKYRKFGKTDSVRHILPLSRSQIYQLTSGMTDCEREKYVEDLYNKTGKTNYVKDTYFANYDIKPELWHEDIRVLDASSYRNELDIMVGGSPCQSFSTYGKKMGLEDARGTLFYDYARIIKESNPKIFIYENVPGLITHDKGRTWKIMLEIWNSLGYKVCPNILNSSDYNHPQNRRRLFLLGFRNDIYYKEYKFPEIMELNKFAEDFLDTNIDDCYYLGQKGFEWVTDAKKNKNKTRYNRQVIGCETANQQFNWIGDLRVERPKPEHYKNPNIYIGKFDIKDGLGCCDAVARKMTPKECLRLMGFDDTFKIVVDDKEAYRQAGNSIVVPVLKEIIKSIYPYLCHTE